MPPKPRSLLFDDVRREGQGGCHLKAITPPESCLAAYVGFSPEAEVRKPTPKGTLHEAMRLGLALI
jgi:hypothetical protein